MKFADDTKLARIIRNIKDAMQMQKNLDDLFRWAEKWRMSFNAKKCKVIHFRKKNISYEYHLDGCAIESVSEEKDLGVWMEEDMRPTKRCKMAAQTANWALGQLTKTFHYRKATYLVPLYKSFVRPKLEHAVGAWCRWLECSMGNVRLDSCKNFFTVRVIAKWNRIPDDVKRQRTINAFKNSYDRWKEAERRQKQQQT